MEINCKVTSVHKLFQTTTVCILVTLPDMPTFENQKEESLTMEARRADDIGPTIEARRADKLKSS